MLELLASEIGTVIVIFTFAFSVVIIAIILGGMINNYVENDYRILRGEIRKKSRNKKIIVLHKNCRDCVWKDMDTDERHQCIIIDFGKIRKEKK